MRKLLLFAVLGLALALAAPGCVNRDIVIHDDSRIQAGEIAAKMLGRRITYEKPEFGPQAIAHCDKIINAEDPATGEDLINIGIRYLDGNAQMYAYDVQDLLDIAALLGVNLGVSYLEDPDISLAYNDAVRLVKAFKRGVEQGYQAAMAEGR